MERPQSQLENVRPSGLKLPSRLPAFNAPRTLQETTQSDLNVRTAANGGPTMTGPPPGSLVPSKHKVSGLPEPPTKRKTLAERVVERAVEPVNGARSHIPGKSSISNGFGTRPNLSTNVLRTASNAPATASLRNARPPSRQALGLAQMPPRTTHAAKPPHPAHSQYEDDSEGDSGITASRKGTPTLSFNHTTARTLHLRKTRTHGDLRQHAKQNQSAIESRFQHSGQFPSIYDDSDRTSAQTSRNTSASSMSSASAPAPKSHHPTTHHGGTAGASQPSSEVSLNAAFSELSITPKHRTSSKHRPSLERIKEEVSPTKIPKVACVTNPPLRHTQSAQALRTPSPIKMKPSMAGPGTPVSIIRRKEAMPIFLTKDKLTPVKAWDTTGRLDDMERMFNQLKGDIVKANDSKSVIEESLELYKTRAQELTTENREMNSQMRSLSSELERVRSELHTTSTDLRQMRRDHERESLDMERKYEREIADLRSKHEREQSRFEREREKEADRFRRELEEAKKAWEKEKDRESTEVIAEHWDEMDQLRKVHEAEKSKMQKELDGLRKAQESRATESASEVQLMKEQNASLKNQLEASRAMEISLKGRISTYESRITALEQEKTTLLSKTHFLEGNQEAQSQEFTDMAARLQEAIAERDATVETLRKEERLRRKLNATILELRGNIRVFVRTRPLLNGENDPAKVEYLEEDSLDGCKEMVVHAPTSQSVTGKVRNEKHNYGFDRVFTPGTPNDDVFEECRDLIQSVVDGYNVSILSYGQTGSGKTYGMTGPQGIIPSAIHMLLSEMQRLKDKGWEYAVEANFVEVYNETLNDLLGDAKAWDDADDMGASVRGKKKEKHEIHHDAATGKTTVTNLTTVGLWPPQTDDGHWPPTAPTEGAGSVGSPAATSYTEKAVNHLLDTAAKNRRVAATKANERSSRSHSIFILTLKGSCAATNETSEGILNLVDLAGSERLKQSGAEGSRMKETQAINKSLSSLGDVIAALGNKSGNSEAHVPYRNSKLTYLLQSSLGGTIAGKSSRTLMLLHLSPLQAHWQESRSSLLFGSKVHGTHIGTAKKR